MTREEMKCKGKRLDNGQWVYGFYCKYGVFQYAGVEGHYIINGIDCYEVDPETVGQFTGKKDINRKDVYEKDLIKGDGYGPYPVFWDDGHCGFCSCCYSDAEPISRYKRIEVTGNTCEEG